MFGAKRQKKKTTPEVSLYEPLINWLFANQQLGAISIDATLLAEDD